MTETVKKVRMVFARNCRCVDKSVGQIWFVLDADDNLPETPEQLVYGAKAVKSPWPGQIYEFDQTQDKDRTISKARYIGMYQDEDKRREWTALHRGFNDNLDIEKRQKKDRKDDPFDPLLDKLSAEYYRLVGGARTMFLARVIGKITGMRHP